MFDCSLNNLTNEIKIGENRIAKYLKTRQRMLSRFVGPSEASEDNLEATGDGDPDLENQALSWLLLFKALVAFHNPRVKVRSRRAGVSQVDAKGLTQAMNRSVEEQNYRDLMDRTSDDFGFNWAVVMTRRAPRLDTRDWSHPTYLPESSLLQPEEYGWDAAATDHDHARIRWHRYTRDLSDCFDEAEADEGKPQWEQEGWNIDALRNLVVDNEEVGRLVRPTLEDGTLERHEVVFRDVFVAEYELPWLTKRFEGSGQSAREAGFNGTIFTIAMTQEASTEMLLEQIASDPDDMEKNRNELIQKLIDADSVMFPKKPRPFYGPPSGPYRVIGALTVPGRAAPLGMIAAMEDGAMALNRADKLISVRMHRKKQGVAYDSKDTVTAGIIADAEDGAFVPIPHLGRDGTKLQPFKIQGFDEADVFYRNDRREILHRNLGLSDAMQGQGTSNLSATSDSIAAQSAGARLEVLASKFIRGHEGVLEDQMWYVHHDPDYVTVIGDGKYTALYLGGHPSEERLESILEHYPEFAPQSDEEFDELFEMVSEERSSIGDMQLKVVLSSTQRQTPQAKMRKVDFTSGLLQTVIVNAPQYEAIGFDVQSYLDEVCELEDCEWFAKLYNAEASRALAQAEFEHPNQVPNARMEQSPRGIQGAFRHPLMMPGEAEQAATQPAPSGQSAGASAGGTARGEAERGLVNA